MKELLELLEKNPNLTPAQLGAMLGKSRLEIEDEINDLTAKGIIKGYRAIIDWDKVDQNHVRALIEVKVSIEKSRGFDDIAMSIAAMDEVESVTLISGGYDLLVEIKAKTFQDIAMFVFKRLSPMDGVNGTATHFVLRAYKQFGVIYYDGEPDERGLNSL
jgi:DNA-binding Lrp family transcriptional regulator